jgi:type IV pilus assembly protein PilN
MRLNINLATQPYEDVRRFMAVWTAILGTLLISAALLSILVYKRWHEYRLVSRAIAVEKKVLQDLDTQQSQDLAILNRPENQDVRERSEFLNQLIRRKGMSWTRIFSELEKMMPAHLRVLSVQPKVEHEQIVISMQLGGDSRDRAAELVRRMEKSKMFRHAQFVSESDLESASKQVDQDPKHFVVQAEYIPVTEQPVRAEATPTAGGGT